MTCRGCTCQGSKCSGPTAQRTAEQKTGKKAEKGDPGSDKQGAPEAEPAPKVDTDQVTVLGMPELGFLRSIVAAACQKPDAKEAVAEVERLLDKDAIKNLNALRHGAGLGAALFGRMVTGDILARVDAAIHVAHAMTVHGEHSESDYFSALDDILKEQEGEQGSGHINSSELTSGLFYGYVSIDVPLLVSNLSQDRTLAGDVIERLVHMVATVSPGAKKGSTAPYAYAHLVLAEAGKAQPRTLANAFLEPVRVTPARPSIVENAYVAVAEYLKELDAMYGVQGARALAGIKLGTHFDGIVGDGNKTLADLADWAKQKVVA
ncbi:MAG: type I-E CRISPR-associated protein Cas7/Cse4/CasC [Deltaproteobacteria bacterium]|nr:type I-E CRISPR-associated protein Cas7/Cse4/CasC [Deltaproteobacteria bacterium]